MIVYILKEEGDDYHGSGIIGVYQTREAAEAKEASLTGIYTCRPTHPKCDFQYSYYIDKREVENE